MQGADELEGIVRPGVDEELRVVGSRHPPAQVRGRQAVGRLRRGQVVTLQQEAFATRWHADDRHAHEVPAGGAEGAGDAEPRKAGVRNVAEDFGEVLAVGDRLFAQQVVVQVHGDPVDRLVGPQQPSRDAGRVAGELDEVQAPSRPTDLFPPAAGGVEMRVTCHVAVTSPQRPCRRLGRPASGTVADGQAAG